MITNCCDHNNQPARYIPPTNMSCNTLTLCASIESVLKLVCK